MSVIVDTGCANLTSLKFALERLNVRAVITSDSKLIKAADRVFLPGVGSARYAMHSLEERNLVTVIPKLTQPVLGICLGMQLLMESSTEGGTICLDVIPGSVKALEAKGSRLPHMGWNTLSQVKNTPLFHGISVDDSFYFVHSYAVSLSSYTLATADYPTAFSAALGKNNFFGVQFHPERSGAKGWQLLKNFLELKI
ncbi:MAG: imidazole glycerol phosphate synthase subunit HisH [Candidatus Marinimicrobia bacterium]|nr:imidazole glycerol phosphate synthase subunit HisH [Candidatus Neomarinimicrobiota bacterium]